MFSINVACTSYCKALNVKCHKFREYCLDHALTSNFSWTLVFGRLDSSQSNLFTDQGPSVMPIQTLTQLFFTDVIHGVLPEHYTDI